MTHVLSPPETVSTKHHATDALIASTIIGTDREKTDSDVIVIQTRTITVATKLAVTVARGSRLYGYEGDKQNESQL